MSLELGKPLNWKDNSPGTIRLLSDLQNNILDGHGRKSTRHLFINFDDPAGGRRFLASLVPLIHTAGKQLDDAERFRNTGVPGGPIVGVHLSAAGYDALQLTAIKPKPVGDDDGAFEAGMIARGALLNDPPSGSLAEGYREPIHAMVLIGAEPDTPDDWQSTAAANVAQDVRLRLGTAGRVVVEEVGRAIFSSAGPGKLEGIEHFGYVDGRSQPLMLTQLIDRERDESDGVSVWDPTFPIAQVLVPDPGSRDEAGFGSFFVFRKLEQDVAGFKDAEAKLQAITDSNGNPLGEVAGAMIVGRFEDGTPVTAQREDGVDNPVANNFDYASDMEGLRCPFSAHIRKTNPRGDTVRLFSADADPTAQAEALASERSHIMARRGMTFGTRNRIVNADDRPSGGVGLMFMSFQCNLANQFEFTQHSWANDPKFAAGFATDASGNPRFPPPGRDPVIGQRGANASEQIHVRDRWGWADAGVHQVTFDEFVTHRGGEYFFTPAISTLAALDPGAAAAAA